MSEYNLVVRFILSFLTLISVFSIPIAHAEQSDVWDFRNADHLPDGAQSLSSVTRDGLGMHIKNDTDGFMFWADPLSRPVDILTLRIRTTQSVDLALLWHPKNIQNEQLSNYIHITGSGLIQNVQIAPRDEQGWDWTTDQMALGFPAHADVTLESMTWTQLTPWEKASEAIKSFWTFDTFRSYSINFLWGPLIATNPTSLNKLYFPLPPHSWSVERFLYPVILLSIILGLSFFLFDRTHGKRKAMLMIAGTFIALWVMFDIRMGAEVMHYGIDAYQAKKSPPTSIKMLNAFMDDAQTIIKKYPGYVLATSNPNSYYPTLRYETYPSVPVRENELKSPLKLWLVIQKDGLHVDANNRLVDTTGTILTAPGDVIKKFDNTTFLFLVR